MKNDLEAVYELIKQREDELNSFYELLEEKKDPKKEEIIQRMLHVSTLEDDKQNRLALITRLVNLRDDNLTQALKQAKKSDNEIKKIKHDIYEIVKRHHLFLQKKMVKTIQKRNLLSPFYLAIVKSVYRIGAILSDVQPMWTKHVIEHINEDLVRNHGDNVYKFLEKHQLFEYLEDGELADRSYSILVKEDNKYISKTYIKAFRDIRKATVIIDGLARELKKLEDEEFNQKEAYIEYFRALKIAFAQKENKKLISSWRNVDFAWMRVTSPIQVGHPLEYYEDHFRKSVAIEWDLRLDDIKRAKKTRVKDEILYMYKNVYEKIEENDKRVYDKCVANVNRVGLHIGRPALYFAAEFNGLFSAQVVPNDEVVSKQCGKKIFAFADNIYESSKAKPFLKIHTDIFGKEFLDQGREILFKNAPLWHEVYEASTIGHEFGHILWLDENSEIAMNRSGMFKNIEEFKATTGGLVAFFYNEREHLKRPLMMDLIKRAVGLIGWMKTKEVEPYYCEGLIHLQGLFETNILSFKDKLSIDMSEEAYQKIKKWYLSTYENLARHYLAKRDAKEFLDIYASKNEDGFFLPKDLHVRYFVKYYWNLYEEIGRVIDENEDKSKWIL